MRLSYHETSDVYQIGDGGPPNIKTTLADSSMSLVFFTHLPIWAGQSVKYAWLCWPLSWHQSTVEHNEL
jgi:hypothetical protein